MVEVLSQQEQCCTRCGTPADKLYDYNYKDDDGELINHKLCWSCEHDVMNGGDITDDAGDILFARAENEYEYDPINNERPW